MGNRKKASRICEVPTKNQIVIPASPDPTYEVTKFLSWLKKRGGMRTLEQCKKKWEGEGLNIESLIEKLKPGLCIYRHNGEKVVWLENKPWADQWMSKYNIEVPHHRQTKELEKIISDTETKTKV